MNGLRVRPAAETVALVSPFLLRLGITRLARQTGLDRIGIPVWSAYNPNARAIVVAQGKGMDDDAARASAAMEAVERSVATRPASEPVIATAAELAHDGRPFDRLEGYRLFDAPVSFEESPLPWVRSFDLLRSQATLLLPYDAIHLDRTQRYDYWQSSDGLASGNTREEAILHGLLERVERDALFLWQTTSPARRYARRIDPEGIGDPDLCALLDRIGDAGLEIALFDITTDIALPCVCALLGPRHAAADTALRHVDITLGAGAGIEPLQALARAITEAVQSRMTFISGARDDLLPSTFRRLISPETVAAFDAEPWRQPQDMSRHAVGSVEEALAIVLDVLQQNRITKLYVTDLGPDWLPVSVVKVMAPQLETQDGPRRRRRGARSLARALQ